MLTSLLEIDSYKYHCYTASANDSRLAIIADSFMLRAIAQPSMLNTQCWKQELKQH